MQRIQSGIRAPRTLSGVALALGLACAQFGAAGETSSNQIPASEDAGSYFLISKLNVGLSTCAEEPDLETPHAMLTSFLASCRRGDFVCAAHCLGLNFLPPGEQPSQGPELARKLYFLVEHQLWIDWQAFPDRPDGRQDSVSPDDPGNAAGLNRSIMLGSLTQGGRVVELRVQREKVREGPAVWVFSRQTAEESD